MALLGRYRLLELLGKGGAGEVYLAEDLARGGRKVALKRIRVQVDHLLKSAFEREFAIMASLAVPGIAEVYDFGVAAAEDGFGGGPFFTRAYVPGTPLDQAGVGLSVEGRLEVFAKLCHVVSPLHRVGVVHGDLKPGNVIVTDGGQVSVIDFGLSRLPGARPTGETGGTPPYMAPEIIQGEPVSTASDVYALGVLLHVLLTDVLPFSALGRGALAAKLRGEAPGRPPGLSGLAAAAYPVVERAMAGAPQDRYPTVTEMLKALPAEVRDTATPVGFSAPRPRGREALTSQLEAQLSDTQRDEPKLSCLVGAPGAGKTLLLRELRWRLQLRGVQVIELQAERAAGLNAVRWLERELQLLAGQEPQFDAALDDVARLDGLAAQLSVLSAHRDMVVLVDDIDLADRELGQVLRSLMYEERSERIRLLATATRTDGSALRALGDGVHVLELPPLSVSAITALTAEVLGPIDDEVLAAIIRASEGAPGMLMEVLAQLHELAAVTLEDVQSLSPGRSGELASRARLSRVQPTARPLLSLLCLVESLPRSALGCSGAADVDSVLEGLSQEGLIALEGAEVRFASPGLAKVFRKDLGRVQEQGVARRALSAAAVATLPTVARARLAVVLGEPAALLEHLPPAIDALRRRGALRFALALQDELLPQLPKAVLPAQSLQRAHDLETLGEHEAAVAVALKVRDEPGVEPKMVVEAALLAARSLTALARFDEAAELLGQASMGDDKQRVVALRELARVQLRRGDYAAVAEAAERGLQQAEHEDLSRVELLCCKGVVCGYRDQPDQARACYEEALALAQQGQSLRDEAKVLTYLAIDAYRNEDLARARDLLEQSVAAARRLGDMSSMANASLNLGAVLFGLGEITGSEHHYRSASRLSRRAGNAATDLQARCNLTHLHVYLGQYEQARAELEGLLSAGERLGQAYLLAQLSAIRGDLLARTGDLERALISYDDAIRRYAKLGQVQEQIEHHLDAAEALLDRGGPADGSAAAARLAAARELLAVHVFAELSTRLALLTARVRLAAGEAEHLVTELEKIVVRAKGGRLRELRWKALWLSAQAQRALGADATSQARLHGALEVLEAEAVRLGPEQREAFWHDPRRRALRDELTLFAEHGRPRSEPPLPGPRMPERTTLRLLEIMKRLAAEQDMDRLLERIVESAVELSGAERGFVLRVGTDGQLAPEIVKERHGMCDDASVQFSRSIAEAVLIDGDSIVTMDATHDGRLQEYVSVHQLMLRSVACLPIVSPRGVEGVLYLEHRRSRTCFSEAVVELLHAFADQSAIALTNARLRTENEERRHELERVNQELATAKLQLEEALSQRTEQLLEVQAELSRLRPGRGEPLRHGMVGDSPPMQRLFAMVDRLKDASVSVVVRGESGAGKELVARALHYSGIRQQAPFVAVNCAAIPASLLEAELFGYVKGAFTGADRDRPGLFERAHGGTLFLDEVADMPTQMQVDLLRVLQEGIVHRVGGNQAIAVSVRVVAATQKDLRSLVEAGRFREDLYYRLNVVEIHVPSLRERRGDLPLLCHHILSRIAERDGLPEKRVGSEALRALSEVPFPGNVRELEHRLVKAALFAEGAILSPADLGLGSAKANGLDSDPPPVAQVSSAPVSDDDTALPGGGPDGSAGSPEEGSAVVSSVPSNVDEYREQERGRMLAALESCGWNRAQAARQIGMARRTFYRRLQEYEIR